MKMGTGTQGTPAMFDIFNAYNVSLIIMIFSIISVFNDVPIVSGHEFWFMLGAYAMLYQRMSKK
jgi:hypothetical protein